MPNFVQGFFGGRAANGRITRFELLQRYENHTVAIVDLTVPSRLLQTPRAALYPELTPLVLGWGSSMTDRSTFYGYVNHQEILGSSGGSTVVRYLCLGTSLPLNTVTPQSWTRVTASSIAAQIAKRHRLRALIHRSGRMLATFTISTETDFQAMQRLATEAGFRFWLDGGTLYFVDARALITRPGKTMPRFGAVDQFHITSGTLAPRPGGPVSEKVVCGRDAHTKRPFRVRSNTVLRTDSADTVGFRPYLTTVLPGEVSTYAAARDRVEVASRGQSWQTARVTVPGAPRVRPGRLVLLADTAIPVDHTGVWAVDTARHLMDSENSVFSTEMEISRNQGDGPGPPIRPSQLVDAPDTVACVLRDGAFWESESLDVAYLN